MHFCKEQSKADVVHHCKYYQDKCNEVDITHHSLSTSRRGKRTGYHFSESCYPVDFDELEENKWIQE